MEQSSVGIDKKLIERGYWIATHRLSIKKWLGIVLYVVIAVSYVVFFLQFGVYLFKYGDWDILMKSSMVPSLDWAAAHTISAPRDLEFGTPYLFDLGNGRYDLVVEVRNPNETWAVSDMTFQFVSTDGTFKKETRAFVMPSEKRLLTILGVEAAANLGQLEFSSFDVKWRKMSAPSELSWIYAVEPTYAGPQVTLQDGTQSMTPARVFWTVKNGSTWNISTVTWQAALYNGTKIVHVFEYRADKFPFLEERSFDFPIFYSLPAISKVVVNPLVNVFDPRIFYTPR